MLKICDDASNCFVSSFLGPCTEKDIGEFNNSLFISAISTSYYVVIYATTFVWLHYLHNHASKRFCHSAIVEEAALHQGTLQE